MAAYISRTPAGAGDLRKWTFSAWVKRGNLGGSQAIISWYGVSASYTTQLRFDSDNTINFYQYYSGYTGRLATTRVFKDVGAWYHIVAVWDSDNATPGDRMKLYINGVEETVFATDTNPAQYLDSYANSANEFTIGSKGAAEYLDGDLSHVQFVNGAALAPTEFGEVDSTSGIWKIKTTAYATPGTNGYFLKMEDRTNLDLDSSSNAYTFATTGTLTATYDNPSNNFATWNAMNNYWPGVTFSQGNTTIVTASSIFSPTLTTLGMSGGKWYAEFKTTARVAGTNMIIGVASTQSTAAGDELGNFANDWGYDADDGSYRNNNTSTSYGDAYDTNDIIGVALDLDNNKLYFSKNGTWQDSGDPTSGATGTGAISITAATSNSLGSWFFGITYWTSGGATFSANFGNGYFGTTAVTSAEADDAGIGAMEYDVPAGYYCLCTKNISTQGG